jgi:predicted alpha/beta superfamily hydrolase
MTEPAVPGLLDTEGHLLQSTALASEVALTIWLPPSSESSDTAYPVVYVLDAPMTFAFAAQGALITYLDEAMPEVLVVGVGEHLASAYQWGSNRARNYAPQPVPDDPASGQATTFFDALQQEIVPFVDRRYRTDPTDRTLWGHSFGGAFAVYALLERGGLFHRLIATSPAAYEQGVQLLTPDTWPSPGASVPVKLFTSIGSHDLEYRPGFDWLTDQIRARSYADLTYATAILPDCGHIGASTFGYLTGLRSVFRGN